MRWAGRSRQGTTTRRRRREKPTCTGTSDRALNAPKRVSGGIREVAPGTRRYSACPQRRAAPAANGPGWWRATRSGRSGRCDCYTIRWDSSTGAFIPGPSQPQCRWPTRRRDGASGEPQAARGGSRSRAFLLRAIDPQREGFPDESRLNAGRRCIRIALRS
jgi:hypothetical protein